MKGKSANESSNPDMESTCLYWQRTFTKGGRPCAETVTEIQFDPTDEMWNIICSHTN